MTRGFLTFGSVLLIILITAAIYGPLLDTYFIKDDLSLAILVNEDGGLNVKGWWEQLMWPTARTWDDIWRPVPALTWAVDVMLFGADPVAFHAGNAILHALNGILIFFLLRRFLGGSAGVAPLGGALLFLLWPLQGEAVMWSTQRTVVLGLSFCLLALLLYDRYLWTGRSRDLIFAYMAMMLGVLSREHALTVPASFAVLTMFFGPQISFRARFQRLVRMSLIGFGLIGLYFLLRFVLFGRLVGGYSGWETQAAYRADLRVMERLPATVLHCLVPANSSFFDHAPMTAWPSLSYARMFLAFQVTLAFYAMVRLVQSARYASGLPRILLLALVFSLTAWLPVWQVFYVESNLLNSRSGYHLTALLVACLGMILGARVGKTDVWPRTALIGLVLSVGVYAAVLRINLIAYDEGGNQVRVIQQDILRLAADQDSAYVVAFDVPLDYRGCPTIDAYLPDLLSPPFTAKRLPAVPIVAGTDRLFSTGGVFGRHASGYLDLRERFGPEAVLFAWCYGRPPSVRSLFEPGRQDLTDSRGAAFPKDGEMIVMREGGTCFVGAGGRDRGFPYDLVDVGREPIGTRVTSESFLGIPELEARANNLFRFAELFFAVPFTAGAHTGMLHLKAPGRTLAIPFEVRAERDIVDGHLVYVLSRGSASPSVPSLPWPLPSVVFAPALFVEWQVEQISANGERLDLSRVRRLVLLDGRVGSE